MTGDENDSGDVQRDRVPVAETLDELLASDDSGLCAGLLDVLALLSDVGAARWVQHRAGDLALAAAPGGYGCHEIFASQVIDAAVKELAEARLLTIEEASFGDADADDVDDSDPDGPEAEDNDQEEDYLDDSAFDTVTAAPGAARIIIARHVAAGTDSELLTDGMTACWDTLRPYLGPADSERVKDLLTMRTYGLYSLVLYPDASETGPIGFGEKLVADYEQALGPGHSHAWEARRNIAHAYERAGRGDEAIGAFAGLLTDKEDVLPADDRGVLDARDDLALAHMNAGRYPEAVSQYTELLADYERVAGPRDSLTLSVRGALGEAYLEVGRIAEGTELMEAAAAGLAAIFGPDSPEVTRFRESIDEGRTRRRMAL